MNNSRIRIRFKESCLKQDKVMYTPRNVANLSIFHELDRWLKDLNPDFALKDGFFGVFKLDKNAD